MEAIHDTKFKNRTRKLVGQVGVFLVAIGDLRILACIFDCLTVLCNHTRSIPNHHGLTELDLRVAPDPYNL